MFGDNNLNHIALMKNKEGLEALFEYATEGILVANAQGNIVKLNPAIERMFGYEKEELLNQKVELLVPSSLTHKHSGYRSSYHTNPHPRSMGIGLDLFGKRKDASEFPLEISLSPFTSEGETLIIAFIVDITLRKAAEERLKNYSLELENKVEERTMILREAIDELEKTKDELNTALVNEKELNDLKSRFVSMVSHEFRTPLAAVMSSLSLVRQHGEAGNFEKQSKHIQRIKESVYGLTDILNDMLSISKLEEGKVEVNAETVNCKECMKDIVTELNSITKKGQQLVYKHSGHEEGAIDKKIIKHILYNLISNAVKFSPDDKNIYVNTNVENSRIILKVRDEGIGISKEDQQHLFERFFRGQNASNIQGTGLGLNIVAKYVEILGGELSFESKLNEGTTFTIVIPHPQIP